MIKQEHLKMPSELKMHRGRLIIEALQKEIYIFGYMSIGLEPFKSYPNWRADYKDYTQMLRAARDIMKERVRVEIDASGFGGVGGSQFIVIGHEIKKNNSNLFLLIDKAAANIAIREQSTKGVSDEEMDQIYEEAESAGLNIDEVWKEKVIPRLPRTVEQISSSIFNKILSRND